VIQNSVKEHSKTLIESEFSERLQIFTLGYGKDEASCFFRLRFYDKIRTRMESVNSAYTRRLSPSSSTNRGTAT
jgi:hypothetical protein